MPIRLSSGHLIEDPEARVREYVRVEVYRGYDDQHSVTNEIGWADVRAANRLYARLGRETAAPLVASERVRADLAAIPDDDLDAIPDESWRATRSTLKALLAETMRHRGVALAVATKILHLKRPRLIPVLDSFVVELLKGIDLGSIDNKQRLADIGMMTIETIREDLCAQREQFDDLQASLTDLPIPLTRIRLYDVLCWSTEKWDVRGDTSAPFGTARASLAKGSVSHSLPGAPSQRKDAVSGEAPMEIRTVEEFQDVVARGDGFVVITDSANPTRLHRAACSRLREPWFATKVVENRGRNGRYYWYASLDDARASRNAKDCSYCA